MKNNNDETFAEPTRWWWVRHAPVVDADPLVRISAQLDVAAKTDSAESIKALKCLAEILPAQAKWIITNLKRTRQTAEAIIAAGERIKTDINHMEVSPQLAEQNFGSWAGMTWDELGKLNDGNSENFWKAPATTAPPGGESFADLIARVAPAIEDLSKKYAGRDIICVAHAGTIRGALAMALELPAEKALSFNVGNLSLTRIDHINSGLKLKRGGHWRVVSVNINY